MLSVRILRPVSLIGKTVRFHNPRDPSYDPWSQLRDTSADPEREPGPFFPGRLSNAGVLTFFDLPVAVNQADLIAGEVDVAIMGAQIDMGVGMRGAKYGPGSLRESLPVLGAGKLPHMHVGVAWQRVLRAVDYGNAPIDQLSVERSMAPVRELVREIASTGAIPIVIGGDHSLEYPDVAGVADVYGKENVGVIHFDAHYDAGGSGYAGHLISHAQPVYRLIEEGHVLGENYIQVGLRGFWPGEEGLSGCGTTISAITLWLKSSVMAGTRSWSEFSRKRMMGRNISMCPLISMCWIQPSHRAREHRSLED